MRVLERYRVESPIAAGSFGAVYAAIDTHTSEKVALKFFDADDVSRSAWHSELRLALRLRHRNIVRCKNIGIDDAVGQLVLVLERAFGGSLRKAFVNNKFDAASTRQLAGDIAEALVYTHDCGIMHRDIKPENILAAYSVGEAPWLLTDFGVGRFLGSKSSSQSVVGSLHYLAPEVIGRRSTYASDIYSLALVCIEALVGGSFGPRERSRFVDVHRGAPGLLGVIAVAAQPSLWRRVPSARCLARALADDCREQLEVVGVVDGPVWGRYGDELFSADLRGGSRRLSGVRKLLRCSQHGSVVAGAGRRLCALDERRSTLYYDREEVTFWGFDGVRGRVVVQRGENLELRDTYSGNLRSSWRAQVDEDSVVAVLGDDSVVFAPVGAKELRLLEPAASTARSVALPGPMQEVAVDQGACLALCGDSEETAVMRLSPTRGDSVLFSHSRPFDTFHFDARMGRYIPVVGAEERPAI